MPKRVDYPSREDARLFRDPDAGALRSAGQYLRDIAYNYFAQKMSRDVAGAPLLDFRILHSRINGLSGFYRLVFSLFWQGHSASDVVVKHAFPATILDAFVESGLLVSERSHWRTPGVAIVPVEGLNLVVALPPSYPTARWTKQPVYLGPDSFLLIAALPANLRGKTVLDVCTGSGVQALVCLSRGASAAVALEKNPVAVSIARVNVVLNQFEREMRVLDSDLFEALPPDSMFDVVVSNPPFMPVADGLAYPMCGAGGSDGLQLLRQIITALPSLLTSDGEAYVIANVLGDQWSINCTREVLGPLAESERLHFTTFVSDKQPFTSYVEKIRKLVEVTSPEVAANDVPAHIERWRSELQNAGVASDFVYLQLLKGKRSASGVVEQVPFYPVEWSDPLVSVVKALP
jgi:hypothetical protein